MRDYASLLKSAGVSPAEVVARSGHIVRYRNNFSALVRTSRGLEVATSTVPLRAAGAGGGDAPVDLRLTATKSAFAPKTPVVPVSIARKSEEGVSVASDGLGVTLEGADVAGTEAGGQSVFFADVARDVDAVDTPTMHGVDLSAVIRSTSSPQMLRYRVALPAGTAMRELGAGAVITRAGAPLIEVPAPRATDAQGRDVPVKMTVVGNELIVTIPHRSPDLAYPILVDPEILEANLAEAPGEWVSATHGSPVTKSFPAGGPISISTSGKYSGTEAEPWGNEVYAEYEWLPPEKTGEISSVEFLGVTAAVSASAETGGAYLPEYAVFVKLGACGAIAEDYKEQTAEKFEGDALTSSTLHDYNKPESKYYKCNKEPIFLSALATATGENNNEEKTFSQSVTESASISVGSVLIYQKPTAEEEREKEYELWGENNPGKPGEHRCLLGHPVDCATGNQVESQTDLSVGGRGLGLNLTRTYNSQWAAKEPEHGIFGYGWTGPYTAHVIEEQRGLFDYATVTQDNGSTVRFKRFGGKPWEPIGKLVQSTLAESSEEYTYTLPNQTSLHFNRLGQLTSESDRNGNMLTMHYGAKYLESVSDSAGRKLSFAYNAAGAVESAKDPMGHTVKYTYESGNLASVTQPGEASVRWKFKYNAEHEMTSETDGRGNSVTTEYDGLGEVASQKDPLGRTRKWEYAPIAEGKETTITEPNGSITRERFDEAGLPTNVIHAYGTAVATEASNEYNSAGELIATVDPDKHKTEYGYNAAGDRTSEKDADGDETKWSYDGKHDVETVTTPDGETTTIKRDAHGNAESVSREAPGSKTQVTKYKYDAYGDLESTTNPLEHTWTYEYDSYGDRKSETDPESDKRTWEFNEDSQEIATVSPRGNAKGAEASKYTTKTERDYLGRPLAITDPLGHKTKYKYDGNRNLETLMDPDSNITKYTYDADNELTKVEAPNKATIETGYDSAGQITSQTSGKKNITKYTRNLLEEITEVLDPLSDKTIKEYDPAGNLTKVTDAAKRVTTYSYDPANRLKEISYSDGKTHAIEYEYNKDGEITTIKDGSGTTKYTYDQLDRPTEIENGHKEVIKREYDLGNELIKLTYPNGKAITRTYDKDGRLEKVTDWLAHTTKFAYDPDSNLTATVFPTGTENEDKYVYSEVDQIGEIKMMKGTETLASLVYTRENDGQVKGATSKGLPGEEKPAYEYDANSRLTKGGTTSYEYDADNEPTKLGTSTYTYNKTDELETGLSLKYTYNEVGERTKTTPTTGPATTYGYDQAGNLTTVERPKEGTTEKIEDTYGYNGNGLRVSQTISGTTSYLAWDAAGKIPVLLSDGINSYIYGPENLPIEQINNSTGTVLYLHHDQQGSTRLLTGSTGKSEAAMTYDAYGNTTGITGSVMTPLGFDGQYTNNDTGLIYLRARAYDPKTAQFISVDPLFEFTRAPYTYTHDRPLSFTDPSGLVLIGVGGSGSVSPFGPFIITGGGMGWLNPGTGNVDTTATSGVEVGGSSGELDAGPVVGVSNANSTSQLTGPFTQVCGAAALIVGAQACIEVGHDSCGESIWSAQAGPIVGWGIAGGVGKSETVIPTPIDQDPVPSF